MRLIDFGDQGLLPECAGRLIMRKMALSDLNAVMEIENRSFPSPWSKSLFTRELSLEFSHNYVFEVNAELFGYISFWLVHGEVHIMSIAVNERRREMGVGTEMLRRSLERAKSIGGEYAFLEVREKNHPAITLYTNMGFDIVEVRKGYYTDTKEDALVMAKML